jgi:hypothetical protein
MPSPEEVIERLFTSVNPTTLSKPPSEIAWVVFGHGTVFFTVPTEELPNGASPAQIEAAGRAALAELGPVMVATPSADFSPTRLASWYPDDPVWFVGFDHPSIVTIVTMPGTPLLVGMEARRRRQLDHDEGTVTLVRGFDGTVERRTS